MIVPIKNYHLGVALAAFFPDLNGATQSSFCWCLFLQEVGRFSSDAMLIVSLKEHDDWKPFYFHVVKTWFL